ncbi:MAG: RdgB/HAM1 family non-canonical purine NTP pyrophosphatase [Omnitrophica WOR_2 bacterium]
MDKLLLATENKGKIREVEALLRDLDIELITPEMLQLRLEVEENGHTYAENAASKALAYAQSANLFSLADDSGLEVDALGGAPGVHSHRFSPLPEATDADRRTYLLQKLGGHPRPWSARFHCTVALAAPNGNIRFTTGNCPGEIIPQERGQNGFGYDPIFYLPEKGLTMAELSMEEKNLLSHRARAVIAARPLIKQYFGLS